MSPEAQRIAIAEACGWTECYFNSIKRCVFGFMPMALASPKVAFPVPDYLNDLNAMNEARKSLKPRERAIYVEELGRIQELDGIGIWSYDSAFQCVDATATAHAEAFLKAKNLWTP